MQDYLFFPLLLTKNTFAVAIEQPIYETTLYSPHEIEDYILIRLAWNLKLSIPWRGS